jgi:hypothetical protein
VRLIVVRPDGHYRQLQSMSEVVTHEPVAAPVGRREATLAIAADRADFLVGAGVFVAVAGLAAAEGGYFPTSWGWSALAFAWVALVALVVRADAGLAPLERAFLGGLGALVAWTALSTLWSADVPQTVLEVERGLVLVTGVGALLLVARRSSTSALLGGVIGGIAPIALYALATRLFPERLGVFDSIAVYRLAEPLGYWNALGMVVALGLLLSAGFVARARSVRVAAAAAALVPVLAATLYFTYSRGAWTALAVGAVAATAVDPGRLRFAAAVLAVAGPAVVAVGLASSSPGLTRQEASLVAASREGHRLALWIVLLALAGAVLGAAFVAAGRRIVIGRTVTRAFAAVLAAAVLAGLGLVVARFGSPPAIAERAWNAFAAPPPQIEGDLNDRLFSFSGNGRADLWRAAWAEAKREPLLGGGAGSFESHWLQHREVSLKVRDAHGLFVETLAELGPLGLALLVGALAVPLVAAVRARKTPLVPAAFGAYVAYVVHAGVDWDWEMAALTLTALLCGCALLLASRQGLERVRPLGLRSRVAFGAIGVAVAAFVLVGAVGNGALASAGDELVKGNLAAAEREARKAARWAPWAAEPWQQLGEAQLRSGRPAAAAASFVRGIAEDPGSWRLWFDLARATNGPARDRAFERAAALNPLSPEIARARLEFGQLEPRSLVPEETTK